MKKSCLISICLPFQLFAYFYENFCIEKFISDMVHRFQWDQLRKKHFEIVFNLFLHQVGIPGPSQTQSNIQIFFMSLSGRHCSQNISPHDCQRIPVDLYGFYITKLVVFSFISGGFYKNPEKLPLSGYRLVIFKKSLVTLTS